MLKFITTTTLSFIFSCQLHSQSVTGNSFTCRIFTDKTTYKIGETPVVNVEIINNTDTEVYLIGSLDASDCRWRMPYCYFSIDKPLPDTILMMRCGNMNTLRKDDFIKVSPGGKFNPFADGFFGDYSMLNPQNFRHPGVYTLQFHYNSNSEKLEDFLGDKFGSTESATTNALLKLFTKVPRIKLESNELRVTYVE